MPIPGPVDALLTLDELKAQLNITSTTHDDELNAYVQAAIDYVNSVCGPTDNVTVVETHYGYGGTGVLVLKQSPVVSVSAVTSAQTSNPTDYDASTFVLDSSTGLLRLTDGGVWSLPVTVTYLAGRTEVPAALNLAARIIAAHLWETQRGNSRGRPIAGADDADVSPSAGYSIPRRAVELLAPYRLAPAVA